MVSKSMDDFKLLFMASDVLFLNAIAGRKLIVIAFWMLSNLKAVNYSNEQ